MKRVTVLHLSRRLSTSVIIRCGVLSLILLAILFPSRLMPFKAQAKQTTFGKDGGTSAGTASSARINSFHPREAARYNNENAPSPSTPSVKKAAERTSAAPVGSGPGRLIFAVGGVFNGFVMTNTDGTNAVNLTDSGSAQLHHPSVSPKTGMIAFDAQSIQTSPALPDRDRRIFVMNGDGSGVRQITFIPTGADPTFSKDFNPEISPDGSKVAFMSQRTSGQVHTCQDGQTTTTQNEVWVVNVDGTNLQQVTHPKYLDDPNYGCASGNNYAVAWSPDSQQLAILGQRPYTFQKISIGTKGLYFAISLGDADQGIAYNFSGLDGGDKEPVMKARIKGGPGFIDWAPSSTIMFPADLGGFLGEDASSIGYLRPGIAFCGVNGGGSSTGGTGGGFADCTPASTLVGQVGYGGTTDGQPHGGSISGAPGSVRYSPDGAGLAFAGTSPLANNNLAPTVFIGSGGSPILPSQGSGHLDGGLSWPAGPAISKPDKLVLAPSPLVLYDQHSVQVTPTLLDALGNVIVRAAVWRGGNAGFHCDNTPDQVTCSLNQLGDSNVDFTGTVTGRSFETVGNLCATNAGLRACVPYFNSNSTPVVTVAATQPVASIDTASPGVFTVTRSGAPNALALASSLQIPFTLSGSATAGVDFFTSVGQVATIPAGQTSTTITVTPLFNPLNTGDKTVTLAFVGGNTSLYYVGFPADQATIKITGSTNPPAALSILKITPNKGGDGGAVSVSVFGQGIKKNATLKLVLNGQPTISANTTLVNDAGTSLATILNLIGKADGVYDVVVTNPDGTMARLPAAFSIDQNQKAQMWVSILGRNQIRSARESTFDIVYGNRGNVDAFMVPLIITGIPLSAEVKLDFDITPLPQLPGQPDFSQLPVVISSSASKIIPLILPRVSAGVTQYLRIRITIPGAFTDLAFSLKAFTMPPLLKVSNPSLSSISVQAKTSSQQIGVREASEGGGLVELATSDEGIECIHKMVQAQLQCATGLLGGGCLEAGVNTLNATFKFAAELTAPNTTYKPSVMSMAHVGGQYINLILECLETATPIGKIIETLGCLAEFYEAVKFCNEVKDKFDVEVHRSRDPNEKIGAQGLSAAHFISGAEPLRYSILFENQETATAPAQDVVVTDQLDVSKVDLSTFSLGDISFGSKLVNVPPNLATYDTDVDLRPAKSLIVRIHAALNPSTGVATWRFQTIDPVTNQPTTDPIAGFLPPNTDGSGEGGVFFTVMPKVGQPSGTQISNTASIVFDANAPMNTNTFTNTLDNSNPASSVLPPTVTGCATSFTVQWSGSDTGSGIQSYKIYVSDNGGGFQPFLLDTSETSATYTGQAGHNYAFYSVARDNAGNVENKLAAPDVTVTLLTPAPPVFTQVPSNVTVYTGPGATSCGVIVNDVALGTALAHGGCSAVTITRGGVPTGNVFPLGSTTITYTATDGLGQKVTAAQTVNVIDNTPPVITLNGASNLTVEACARFTDPGAIAIDNCAGNLTSAIVVTGSVNTSVPGTYVLHYNVSDPTHNSAHEVTRSVKVVDTTPPVISGAAVNPTVIWPPDNKMVDVTVTYATSDCQTVTTSLTVSSNEPTSAGDTVVVNSHLVRLRASRLGSGNGRTYTITIKATDSSGNMSSRQVVVRVPHDQGN